MGVLDSLKDVHYSVNLQMLNGVVYCYKHPGPFTAIAITQIQNVATLYATHA